MSAVRCSRLWMAEAVRDGRLKGGERESYLRHLKTCPQCLQETELLESLGENLRRLPAAQPDPLSLRRQRNRLLADVDVAMMQRLHRRGRRWPVAGLAALAACLLMAVVLGRHPRLSPRLPQDAMIEVNAQPGSEWHQSRGPGLTRIELVDGSFALHIRRTSSEEKVLIDTPDGEIEDRGTVLSVTAAQGRTRRIAVDEGEVAVRLRDSAEIRLRAGQSWEAPPATAVAAESSACPSADGRRGRRGAEGTPIAGDETAPRARKRVVSSAERAVPAVSAEPARPAASSDGDSDAEDRAYLRVVHLLQAGDAGKARLEARGYLIKFPNGFRRVEMLNVATGSVDEAHP